MSLIEKMRREFFDVSHDGTLVYADPSIGPLCNPAQHLAVRLNTNTGRFELTRKGQVEQAIDLGTDVRRACREAFSAYFCTLERLFKGEQQNHAAA